MIIWKDGKKIRQRAIAAVVSPGYENVLIMCINELPDKERGLISASVFCLSVKHVDAVIDSV